MQNYFVHRLLLVIPTFLGVTVVVFAITRFVPGGPLDQAIMAQQMAADESGGSVRRMQDGQPLGEAQLEQLREYYGLDKPVVPAYVEWIGKVLRGDFGRSTRYGDPVLTMIVRRIPISLHFGIISLLLTYLISIPLGISKALKHRTAYDNMTSGLVFIGYALPGYIVGIILLTFFAFRLDWFPIGGFQSAFYDQFTWWGKLRDRAAHMALPLVAYTLGNFAVMTVIMKNNLMENMAADYIKTAMAKGRTFRAAMWRHAFRNSLIPIASGLGGIISVFLAGSFLVERIFNIRGMGMLGFTSIVERDYPIVMGVLALSSLASLLGNILSDFIVSLVDPRIRLGE